MIKFLALIAIAASAFAVSNCCAQNEFALFENIKYAQNQTDSRAALNVFAPSASVAKPDKGFPCVLLIHGGGWQEGNQYSERNLAEFLAQNGYVVATPTYRLLPQNTIKDCVEDCKLALRWFKQNAKKYGGNPDKMGVVGGSAGGHLSLLTAMTSGKKICKDIFADGTDDTIIACVSYAPPTNLKDFERHFKGNADSSIPFLKEYSPLTYVDKDCPPILIIHAKGDKTVPISQSRELVEKAKKYGEKIEFIELDSPVHPFWAKGTGKKTDGKPLWEIAYRQTLNFLNKYLK